MTTCTYAYIHTHVCRVVYLQVCKLYIVHLFFPAIVSPSSVKVVFALLSGHNMKSDLLGWWIQCADHAANKSLSIKLVPEIMDCGLACLLACLLAGWLAGLLAAWPDQSETTRPGKKNPRGRGSKNPRKNRVPKLVPKLAGDFFPCPGDFFS